MKLAVVFDCHLWPHKRCGGPLVAGNNRRGLLTLQTLRAAVDGANAENAPLVVAGDLIDEAGPIWPQFAAAIREELNRTDRGVYLIPGNHDMTAADDNSLQLYANDRIQVVNEIIRVGNADFVPFHCDFTSPKVSAPLVVAHFGVFDDRFPSFMKKSADAWHVARLFAFQRERGIKCGLYGDWHRRYIWSFQDSVLSSSLPSGAQHRTAGRPKADQGGWNREDGQKDSFSFEQQSLVMQGGALAPTGWDNKGLCGYGTLAVVDTTAQTLTWRELPGPRFCTAYDEQEEQELAANAAAFGHQLFLRRYFEGSKPQAPEAVEAYEVLPIALQQKAKLVLGVDPLSTHGRFESLVSEWLDSMRAVYGENSIHEQLLKKYL